MEEKRKISADVNRAVELLKVLISTPSISREENDAADRLQTFIERSMPVKFEMHRHMNNIWCIAPGFDAARPTLLLDAHIDTVKPTKEWTTPPFTPIVDGDKITGLGSNDDGASLVTLLMVFYYLCENPQSYNVIFLASAEEEVSGKNGIEAVTKSRSTMLAVSVLSVSPFVSLVQSPLSVTSITSMIRSVVDVRCVLPRNILMVAV